MSPGVRCTHSVDGDARSRVRVEHYSAAYERMRACVIEVAAHAATGPRQAVGLGLVLREGVAGWLKAQADAYSMMGEDGGSEDSPQTDGSRPQHPTVEATAAAMAADILPPNRQPDVTLLIANMVASTQRSRHPGRTGDLRRHTHSEEVALCS